VTRARDAVGALAARVEIRDLPPGAGLPRAGLPGVGPAGSPP
jgi:hypothetical protein